MDSISINKVIPDLSTVIDKVNQSHKPTLITVEEKKAVLLSLEDWNSIKETLYLVSIPGVKDDLIEGKNTPWEECTPLEEVEW